MGRSLSPSHQEEWCGSVEGGSGHEAQQYDAKYLCLCSSVFTLKAFSRYMTALKLRLLKRLFIVFLYCLAKICPVLTGYKRHSHKTILAWPSTTETWKSSYYLHSICLDLWLAWTSQLSSKWRLYFGSMIEFYLCNLLETWDLTVFYMLDPRPPLLYSLITVRVQKHAALQIWFLILALLAGLLWTLDAMGVIYLVFKGQV